MSSDQAAQDGSIWNTPAAWFANVSQSVRGWLEPLWSLPELSLLPKEEDRSNWHVPPPRLPYLKGKRVRCETYLDPAEQRYWDDTLLEEMVTKEFDRRTAEANIRKQVAAQTWTVFKQDRTKRGHDDFTDTSDQLEKTVKETEDQVNQLVEQKPRELDRIRTNIIMNTFERAATDARKEAETFKEASDTAFWLRVYR
jgi:hypothetical protein